MYEVIDNFLPRPYFEELKDLLEGHNFPWWYKKNITYPSHKDECLGNFGFDNFAINDGEVQHNDFALRLSGFLGQLLQVTKMSKVFKCRSDMTLYSPEKYQHTPHVDLWGNHMACILYITNSDAETVIFNEKCYSYEQYITMDLSNLTVKAEIVPKENRLLFFDGTLLHTGHSPSQYRHRIIINTDLL
jgi:hypothetical protein